MNSLAVFTNLLSGDGLIIFLILLLLFGAKRLPELARGLGSAVREFSKAKDEIEHEITRPAPRIEAPRDTEPHVVASVSEPQHVAASVSEPQHGTTPEDPHAATASVSSTPPHSAE